jgi:hypothetical protein
MQLQSMVAYLERTWIGSVREVNNRTVHTPPLFSISHWNHHDSILEGKEITNNHVEGILLLLTLMLCKFCEAKTYFYSCVGFNSGWTKTLPAKTTFLILLEGFVNKESLAQLALREDALAVGGNAVEANRGRKKQDIERRQDLQALVKSWDHGLRREDYMDCLVARMGDI